MTDNGTGGSWGPPEFDPPTGAAAGGPTVPPLGPPAIAAPSWPPMSPPPSHVPGQPGVDATMAGVTPQMDFATPEPPRGRRSKIAVGGALVGVLALGAAGVFAFGQFGGDDSGGAASPEAVGVDMMNAMEQEDVLGMVDLLLPGEREVFREPLVDVVSELSRLDILSADASLGDLAGLDIEMVDEAVAVEPTNVEDISNITMSATLSASLDGDRLPIGDFITDLAGDDFDPGDLDQPTTTEDFVLPMTVVEEDGRWYLSVFHTAAESIRSEFGDPIPDVGLEPRGGATPEGAVDVLLDGVEQLDLSKVIAAINPDEAAALQRYAPLFLDSIAPMADDIGLDWQVTRTEYDVAGSGAKRFVTVTDLRIDGTLEGMSFFFELTDGCLVFEAIGEGSERIDSCELAAEAGDAQTAFDDFFGESIDLDELSSTFEDAFDDYASPGITVQEVDGQWFVSPIGAGFDHLLALLGALDRDELDELVDATTALVEEVGNEFGNLLEPGALGGDVFSDEFADDEFTNDELADGEFTDDEFTDDEVADEYGAEQAILDECFAVEETDGMIECLEAAVEAGDIPDYYSGVELRFPECGVARQRIDSDLIFELSDEDYTAALETASTCFRDLIASGDVDESEVPAEYLRPECAEGQNPWRFDGDDALFVDWLDCIYS